MNAINSSEMKRPTRLARYIRFTADEYKKISDDEIRTKKSAQELLKNAYFNQGPTVMLMTDEDRDRICTQIQRIGSNANQIAKRVNSGFALGFVEEIEVIRGQLTALLAWMTAKYRTHRD